MANQLRAVGEREVDPQAEKRPVENAAALSDRHETYILRVYQEFVDGLLGSGAAAKEKRLAK